MCSSAEREAPYGWDVFAVRPAQVELAAGSPATELADVLQRFHAALRAERGRTRNATDDALAVAVEQAGLIARLESALARHQDALAGAGLGRVHLELRVLKDQMVDALRGGGVTVEDPMGRPVAEVDDRVEAVGWRHGTEFTAEVVAEVHAPIVWYRDAVIRPGRVTMGAPPADDDPGTASQEESEEQE